MKDRQPIFYFGRITLIIIFCIIAIVGFKYWDTTIDGHRIVSLSMISLMCGLLYESFRISEKWIYVSYIFLGALLLSGMAFLPGKHEDLYNFSEKILSWPYWFAGFFIFISVIVYHEKITAKLSEDITLIQTISVVYWVISYGFINNSGWLINTLLIIGLMFSAFALFNALSYTRLTDTKRLWLSIWSTIIMLLFSVDNTIRILNNDAIEEVNYISDKAFIALQYFLLGVSAMYFAQNIVMLIGFFPGKGSNAQYRAELRELKKMHIDRYSDEQAYIGHSILSFSLTASLYGVNYYHNVLPAHIAIMIGFVLFPLLLTVSRIIRHVRLQRRAY